MKKLLILSDSHRNIEHMVQAVNAESPDLIIHLGDHYRDAMELHRRFPRIPLEAVSGNCDFERECEEKLLTIENKKIFLCHGHNYHVKSGYLNLEYAAREKGADLALFGHTHRVFYDMHNGIAMLNPGSIGEPRGLTEPSYGQIIIENNQIFMNIFYLTPEL